MFLFFSVWYKEDGAKCQMSEIIKILAFAFVLQEVLEWGISRGTMQRDHKGQVIYPNGCKGCQWERQISNPVVAWGFKLRRGKS